MFVLLQLEYENVNIGAPIILPGVPCQRMRVRVYATDLSVERERERETRAREREKQANGTWAKHTVY
jgi:hypothetical protein